MADPRTAVLFCLAYSAFLHFSRDPGFLWSLYGAALGFSVLLPLWLMRIMGANRRKREIFESCPDAADLLLVCIEAGLGLDAAMTRVAEEMLSKSHALADELQLTNLEMRAGGTREKALRKLALRTGIEELASFPIMLAQADLLGTRVGDSLRVFSDDLRYKRQMEER